MRRKSAAEICVAPVLFLFVSSIAVPFRRRPMNSSRSVRPADQKADGIGSDDEANTRRGGFRQSQLQGNDDAKNAVGDLQDRGAEDNGKQRNGSWLHPTIPRLGRAFPQTN